LNSCGFISSISSLRFPFFSLPPLAVYLNKRPPTVFCSLPTRVTCGVLNGVPSTEQGALCPILVGSLAFSVMNGSQGHSLNDRIFSVDSQVDPSPGQTAPPRRDSTLHPLTNIPLTYSIPFFLYGLRLSLVWGGGLFSNFPLVENTCCFLIHPSPPQCLTSRFL